MFNIDRNSLSTSIGFALSPSLKKDENLGELIKFWFIIVVDSALTVMNSKVRNVDNAMDDVFQDYEDPRIVDLGETIKMLVLDIKTQFYTAGFDPRLKYKLVTHSVGTLKFYGIAMDLDATKYALLEQDELNSQNLEETNHAVDDHPTIEQLERLYNR